MIYMHSSPALLVEAAVQSTKSGRSNNSYHGHLIRDRGEKGEEEKNLRFIIDNKYRYSDIFFPGHLHMQYNKINGKLIVVQINMVG